MDSILWCNIGSDFSSCIPVTAIPMAKILSFRGKIPNASLLEIFSSKRWILNHANVLSMKVMKLEKSGSGWHWLEPSLLCIVLWCGGVVVRCGLTGLEKGPLLWG